MSHRLHRFTQIYALCGLGFRRWYAIDYARDIEETVKWYLENQEWRDHVTSGEYQKYYDNMYKDR